MIQKTNTVYLELHTYTSRHKNSSVLYTPYRNGICAPRVTRQMSRRQSNSSQTLCNVSKVVEAMKLRFAASTVAKIAAEAGQLFVAAATHESLSTLIFVGCVESKSNIVHSYITYRADQASCL
jgi:hypothetical protein